MPITVWPVDAVAGEPSYSGRELRQAASPRYAGATAARPLGAWSGVRPGTADSTATITGTAWTIKPHAGILDVQASASAGVYEYAIDTDQGSTITAADASNPRKDILYIRLSDPAEGDGTTVPKAEVLYLAGTAAGSPNPPALPSRSMRLATISVPKATTGDPTIAFDAPYCAAAGGWIHTRSATERAAVATAVGNGALIVGLDNRLMYRVYGSTVQPIGGVGPWNNVSSFSANFSADPTVVPRWRLNGSWVECDGVVRKVGAISGAPEGVCNLDGAPPALQQEYLPAAMWASGSGIPGSGMALVLGVGVLAGERTATCDRVSLAGVRYRWA